MKVVGHGADTTELFEHRLHRTTMCGFSELSARKNRTDGVREIREGDKMDEDDTIAARLKSLRESAIPKLSIRALAEMLGMSSSSYNHYETVYKRPFLPLPLTQDLTRILGERGIDKREVLALAGITERFVPQSEPEQMADQLDAVLLREIEVGYSMGGGSDVDDYPVVQMIPFSRAWLQSLTDAPAAQLVVARGEGDSMMPTLLDGDRVIIDLSQRSLRQQDRIWAVSYAGFGMIKRIRALTDGSIQINSDNGSVTPIHAVDGEAYLIGRVVGIIRKI